MCGITGYYSTDGFKSSLEDKLQLIKHRGPDASGEYSDEQGQCTLGFGHRRLSIIDLSPLANQPFISDDGKYVIIFNGEIYNFKELREKLSGQKFRSTSDTEVLLLLYINYGEEMLNWLEGMFVFAIYNKFEKSVFIGRDPLGIKPLYYFSSETRFIFASEIKVLFEFEGIGRKIKKESLTEFLLNGFLYEPDTGFEGIYRLEYGSSISIHEIEGKISITKKKYWRPVVEKIQTKIDLENEIAGSIREHLVSDVPVGLFFSGGIDSSIILNYCKNEVNPFMIRMNEANMKSSGFSSDAYYADKICKEWKVELFKINLENEIKNPDLFLKSVDELSMKTEDLIADFTFVSSQLISREALKNKYKVMLSGMGADEIFGGYPRYKAIQYARLYKLISWLPLKMLKIKSFEKKIQRFYSFTSQNDFVLKYTSLVGYFSVSEVQSLLGENTKELQLYQNKLNALLSSYDNLSGLKKAMILDLSGFLAHNFAVADKSSMLESIEVRVPLASKTLFNIAINMKENNLLDFFVSKKSLKKILVKFLPEKLVYRPKTGFNPPLDNHINEVGYEKMLIVFEQNNLFNFLDREFISRILQEHFIAKSSNNTFKIYQLLFLSYWIKNTTRN